MKETGNVFYVYEHWRPDTDNCFYVGKGKGRRAWDMKNDRNIRHLSVTSELLSIGLTVDVRVIIKDLSNKTAYSLEADRIAFYGVENLVNGNRGGGGPLEYSAESRKKIGDKSRGNTYRRGQTHTPEVREQLRVLGIASIDKFKKYSHLGPKAIARKVICLDDGKAFESANAAARY
jgi:hypothetical protein